jgi:predicted RecA/RadA family phage recombinase
MSGLLSYFDNDGKAVNVTLTAAVAKGQVVVAQGWVGIAESNGAIGDTIALAIDDRAYQITVPAALSVTKGAIVYLTLASVTGHTPQDAAYVLAPAAGTVAFFKAMEAKDANNVVIGRLLAANALAS